MEVLAIIPARFGSGRLPGKPLATIGNKPMVCHVYDRVVASKIAHKTIVATDDELIAKAVEDNGGQYVMTHKDHLTGTERCTEAFRKVGGDADIILNVQGDEPFIECEPLADLVKAFEDPDIHIATLAAPMQSNDDLQSPHTIKIVTDLNSKALYFSRSPIPFIREYKRDTWNDNYPYKRHIGIYAFLNTALEQISILPHSGLENAESLEQLRWLENGFNIHVVNSDVDSFSVDTQDDLDKARTYYKKHYTSD